MLLFIYAQWCYFLFAYFTDTVEGAALAFSSMAMVVVIMCYFMEIVRQEANKVPDPDKILAMVVFEMSIDNDYNFGRLLTLDDYDACAPHIVNMWRAGFFREPDPADMDSSFNILATGEESEVEEFFSSCKESFERVSAVLNDIFDRSGPENA